MQDDAVMAERTVAAIERLRPWQDRLAVEEMLQTELAHWRVPPAAAYDLASELSTLGAVYPNLRRELIIAMLADWERDLAADRNPGTGPPLYPGVALQEIGVPRSTAYDMVRRAASSLPSDAPLERVFLAALKLWQQRLSRRARIAEQQTAGKSYHAARQYERTHRRRRAA